MAHRVLRTTTLWPAVAALLALAPCVALGQSPAAPPPASGTEILLLGTSGGPPLHEDRSEPATLLIVDGRPYLIDCGIGTMRRLLRAGIASETIHTIFFTHLHPDHALGLADVMGNDFFRLQLDQPISIYGPPQTKRFVQAAFRYISLPYSVFTAEGMGPVLGRGRIRDPFVPHDIAGAGVVYQDDRIRVVAAENSHYALLPASARARLKSYAYRIETPHGAIVFTGDTGPADSAVVRLATGADVLVAEASNGPEAVALVNRMASRGDPEEARRFRAHMNQQHLSPEQAGELAAQGHAGSLLLYHFDPSDAPAYVAAASQRFSGPVFAGADLERYCLVARPGPAAKPGFVLAPCQDQKHSGDEE